MRRVVMLVVLIVCAVPIIAASTGCSVKATIKQTTDTTSNVTGTTSGRTWFTEEGQLAPDFKANAFVSLNEHNLRQDMARGHGEYLTSLGTLLGVPADRQADFSAHAQAAYTRLAPAHQGGADDIFAVLRHNASAVGAR